MQVAIGFGFPSDWLINWHEIFEPITKLCNCNRVVTFDIHLKTALMLLRFLFEVGAFDWKQSLSGGFLIRSNF